MSDISDRLENRRKLDTYTDNHGYLDVEAMYEGAAKAEEERQEAARIAAEKRQKIREAQAQKDAEFMAKLGASVQADNEAKAAAEIAKEKAKATAEIETRIKSKHSLPADAEANKTYSQLLKSILPQDDAQE